MTCPRPRSSPRRRRASGGRAAGGGHERHLPRVHQRRRGRRGVLRRGQEPHRRGRRHGRRPGLRRQQPRRAHHAQRRGDDAPGHRAGCAHDHVHRPRRHRRPHRHLHLAPQPQPPGGRAAGQGRLARRGRAPGGAGRGGHPHGLRAARPGAAPGHRHARHRERLPGAGRPAHAAWSAWPTSWGAAPRRSATTSEPGRAGRRPVAARREPSGRLARPRGGTPQAHVRTRPSSPHHTAPARDRGASVARRPL